MTCDGVAIRKELTQAMDRAHNALHKQVHEYDGSEAEMLAVFRGLAAAVAQMVDGGVGMAEACTCLNGSDSQERHTGDDAPETMEQFLAAICDPEVEGNDEP